MELKPTRFFAIVKISAWELILEFALQTVLEANLLDVSCTFLSVAVRSVKS